MGYHVKHGRLEIEVRSALLHVRDRRHAGKVGKEQLRPGRPGWWYYHATKGWHTFTNTSPAAVFARRLAWMRTAKV